MARIEKDNPPAVDDVWSLRDRLQLEMERFGQSVGDLVQHNVLQLYQRVQEAPRDRVKLVASCCSQTKAEYKAKMTAFLIGAEQQERLAPALVREAFLKVRKHVFEGIQEIGACISQALKNFLEIVIHFITDPLATVQWKLTEFSDELEHDVDIMVHRLM